MEEILKYENRDQLYQFLIKDFAFVKIDDQHDPNNFGNFYITLLGNDFLLTYINDRSFLTVNISSKMEPEKSLDLSFVRNFIYHPDDINPEEQEINNTQRIKELNEFIQKDFLKISKLFSAKNYPNTKKQIEDLLKHQFKIKFS